MSSFKRRTTSKQQAAPPGTRVSPATAATIITSTGIPSLDDILGGGLPLSCSLLVLASDMHSAYGDLVCKYFVSQGLACGQAVAVVDDVAQGFVEECMWMAGAGLTSDSTPSTSPGQQVRDDEGETASQDDTKIKIAWRYEQMKQFQTTVASKSVPVCEFLPPLGTA
jgi:elongator complex protein 4